MVKASEIRDEASLRAWLEGRPREDAVAIAARAALRVAPCYWEWVAIPVRRARPSEISILRSLVCAFVQYLRPSVEIRHAGGAAARKSSDISSEVGRYATRGIIREHAMLARTASDAIFSASQVAYAAAESSGASREVHVRAISGVMAAARTAEDQSLGAQTSWDAVAFDAKMLEAGRNPFVLPLWPEGIPAWVSAVHRSWRDRGGGWEFWTDCYEGYRVGKPHELDLLEQVALIPSEDWDKGDDHVNAKIERIRHKYAIARTPNGEVIAVNPETGRLRIEVDTALPADIGAYARRKVRAAVDVFALSHNQYTALTPDLFRLRQAADDPEYTPVELFDECAAASRRLASRIRNGEVPEAEQDALIADYGHRIREAGADILANDPKTQEVLTARARIAGTDALIAEAEAVRAAVDLLVPVTEGLLARRLPEDAAVATDPAADAEDRKVAGIRLASRIVRIARVVVRVAAWTGGAVVGTAAVLEAIPVIQASPIFQALLQAVYRFLGF